MRERDYYTKKEIDLLFKMQGTINEALILQAKIYKEQNQQMKNMIENVYNELDMNEETPTGLTLSGTKGLYGDRFKL